MWPDDTGNWGLGDSYDENRTSSTVWGDIAGAGQAVNDSGTGSAWGGFADAFKTVLQYGLQKDAAKSAAELQRQQLGALTQATTAQAAAQSSIAGIPTGLLLIGGVVLAAVLVLRKA